jgi:hypothetical protein
MLQKQKVMNKLKCEQCKIEATTFFEVDGKRLCGDCTFNKKPQDETAKGHL